MHHVGPALERRDLEEEEQRRRDVVKVAELRVEPLRELGELEPWLARGVAMSAMSVSRMPSVVRRERL